MLSLLTFGFVTPTLSLSSAKKIINKCMTYDGYYKEFKAALTGYNAPNKDVQRKIYEHAYFALRLKSLQDFYIACTEIGFLPLYENDDLLKYAYDNNKKELFISILTKDKSIMLKAQKKIYNFCYRLWLVTFIRTPVNDHSFYIKFLCNHEQTRESLIEDKKDSMKIFAAKLKEGYTECVYVIDTMIALGLDPNVEDTGDHAILYACAKDLKLFKHYFDNYKIDVDRWNVTRLIYFITHLSYDINIIDFVLNHPRYGGDLLIIDPRYYGKHIMITDLLVEILEDPYLYNGSNIRIRHQVLLDKILEFKKRRYNVIYEFSGLHKGPINIINDLI